MTTPSIETVRDWQDRTVVDAARSMGMTELQILFRVEVPNADGRLRLGMYVSRFSEKSMASTACSMRLRMTYSFRSK